MRLPGEGHVIREAAAARQELIILEAANGAADPLADAGLQRL